MSYKSEAPKKLLFETKLTDIESTDIEGVGVLREDKYGNQYRWVKNVDTTAFTKGQPVCYDFATETGTKETYQKVTTPVTAELMNAAGIAVTAIAASGGNCYGWVMVEGLFQDARVLQPTTAAHTIGGELKAVNAQTYLALSVAAGTAPVYSNHFLGAEAVATANTPAATSADVRVKCL